MHTCAYTQTLCIYVYTHTYTRMHTTQIQMKKYANKSTHTLISIMTVIFFLGKIFFLDKKSSNSGAKKQWFGFCS